MLPVAITVERPRRWLPGRSRRTWRRSLPERWEEMPEALRLDSFSRLMSGHPQAMRHVLRDVLHLPRRAWRHLDSDTLASFALALDWMQPAPDCLNPVLQSFRHRGTTYHLPKPGFENGTCLEFAVADDYYTAYRESQDPDTLLLLVATLCREQNPDAQAVLVAGDPRVALYDRDEAVARAKRLAGIDPVVATAVICYWIGVKLLIAETYHELFAEPVTPENEAEEEPQPEPADGPRFGWWSIFLQVAESGTFGDYNTLLQKRLHLICMHLIEQHDKNERLRRAQPTNTPTHDFD